MDRLRLAELLAGLSLVADLGMGLEPGEAGRAALVAVGLADSVGAEEPGDVFYTALLQHVGCTGFAHEAAALLGGDEIAVKRAAVRTDFGDPRDVVRTYLPHLAPAATVATRLRAAGTAAVRARAIVEGYSRANCEVAARMAERLGLGEGVRSALGQIYEQWDGGGGPRGLRGDAIAEPARIAQVAATAAPGERLGDAILGVLDGADPLEAAVAAEPKPHVGVSDAGHDRVCRAFGEAVDLKTPLHHGHATGVAALAAAAGGRAGLGTAEIAGLRRAALVHDLGRAAVPNGIWACPGPLTWGERERVRLHAYHSERVLARCGPLAALAPLAGMHHERLDGSGYHRQATAPALSLAARVLAAADAFQAMTQPRAHRPARTPAEAAALLADDARAGRLDPDAVRAVLEAAGERPGALRRERPAGLTERQIEVLRLLAQGLSNRRIAERLVISPRTAERHVQDLYARIGVSSRAAAALFAMEHDLLARQDW